MRKLFLSLVAILLCSLTSFAQTQIWTAQDFNSVGTSGNYKLMADINLGVFENDEIKSSFSGTFDGNGHTITYQASYNSGSFGLFQSVDGTIKNLTVSASVTFGGSSNHLNVGLLCGSLGSNGLLQSCNVTGVINSTAVSSNGAGTDSGLLVGESSGTIKYCIGNGSVAGIGHVGGLIGRMNGGSVLGSAFTGSLYAIAPNMANGGHSYGSVAGGICGAVEAGSSIKSCFVKADIVAEDANNSSIPCLPYGIASDHIKKDDIDVLNNYCEGTLNGAPIDAHADVTNSNDTGNNSNYYPGYGGMSNQAIVDTLNNAAAGDPNINFGVASDEVIFGVVSTTKVCETPTNLTITNNAGTFTASWTSATADTTITESHWHWSLTGGDAYDNGGDASSATLPATPISVDLGVLPASSTPYTFMVYTDCSETVNGLTSSAISQQFYVDCPAPTALTASNITDNGFTISWTASVDCQLTVNGINYEISAGNPMEKTITGLNPETPYTAIVKAKCGNEYVEQASINVTTARLAAPTGLTVTTGWNGSAGDNGGSATISWTPIEDLTYEVDTSGNTQTSPYQISSTLPQASYTAKVRAKKGDKYSDWASIPYTVSTPNAPSNPIVTYQHTAGEKFNVSISWTPGTESNDGWEIKLNEATIATDDTTNSRVITNQNAGSASIVQIIEKVGEHSTSKPLNVPIQVPCLDASAPTSIVPALNSVTFNFEVAKTRKIVIGSTEYEANNASVTINGLTEGTSYAYEIREYCNTTTNTYSSISSTFSTLACNPVANLSVSNVGQTSATVSWTSQSSIDSLNYKIVVNGGERPVQTAKTINLTELSLATTYTVSVSEQCGTEGNWGEERTITFTTQGAKTYISAKTGNFSDGATWIGGQIPSIGASETASITINAGHTVTLDVTFELGNNITFTNNGVLSIGQAGELINTTINNVGGIVEIVTPIKSISKWTFIGAPFGNGYKLEAVKPVSGSDIAMVKYDYTQGKWSDAWATINTSMEAAEGTFAWPFYGGAVTFTTYGDVIGNEYNYSQLPKYALNNDTVKVGKLITTSLGGNWMALANPYPAKLSVKAFVDANDPVGDPEIIQGRCVYVFRNGTFDIDANRLSTGDINMTEGFFVNFASPGNDTVTFTKDQLSYNQQAGAKASANEFIELTLQNGKDKVRVYFAHNEDAEQGYDIFDANKMFATTGVAEPYFVTDGIALIKEEVRDLPYYATMNVRSQQDTVMNFVLTNLPEGYAVSIIDGEEVIDMVEGGVYSTEIASGENADRFKVLVKKNVGLADVEELDVRITNSNR
ncbi:MAG: fibronectin type III domain-containing protein, partial [Bacteroidales bacterium]|nr:fibronectin type III domain-containing protein [Bacteroidales bacterium]